MQVENDRILDTLTELEAEYMDLVTRIEMYSSHISHLRRPDDVHDADVERDLLSMYEQAGVILPGAIRRRYEDVRAFSASITANRKTILSGQLEDYNERMADCRQKLKVLKARKREALAMLLCAGEDRTADVKAAEARLVERPSG
ncbi:hypothetical protein HFN89_07105 [Rhizobium laguerreae]|nr:hypothetical protein [Rhizobium laguerreae]